jgi:hypothetical protein
MTFVHEQDKEAMSAWKKTQSQSSYGHLSVGGVLLGLSFLPRFSDS